MEPEGSFMCLSWSATCSYSEPPESSSSLHPISLRNILILASSDSCGPPEVNGT